MYELSGNPGILAKAVDFADRMLPAFNTKTGIPTYWVNLKTGIARGDTVNVAEAATYTMEMGILSYYTKDPKYYQAGKKATKAIFDRRSKIGLIGDVINVQTGEWVIYALVLIRIMSICTKAIFFLAIPSLAKSGMKVLVLFTNTLPKIMMANYGMAE